MFTFGLATLLLPKNGTQLSTCTYAFESNNGWHMYGSVFSKIELKYADISVTIKTEWNMYMYSIELE